MYSQQHDITHDMIARIGRALYGERWQTSLAADLHIADRTMRRWVSGESAIPKGVEEELRRLLVERLKEIGGMIGYSVNPANRTVLHYPSGAVFRYDHVGSLNLLNRSTLVEDAVPLITQGAEEALRQEQERDPRIRGEWADPTAGRTGRNAAREAAERIRQMRKGVTLGGIKPKHLINEGRL